MKKIIFLFIFSLLARVNGYSQLTVTTNANATALAQAILGSGVSVSNATINCGANGAGTFNYSGSTLGVTNGIILTSGYATDAALVPAQIVTQSTGNNFNDPDLATIVNSSGTINDVCYIAFDFVPLCNQISITYEFGSSEYDGYQCASYNDAFGLFITGPNPSGGNYTSSNAATLPNGTPVSINNINNGSPPYCTTASNPSYYIDNSSGTDVVYEGLTTAITSVKPVIPCSTYHIKIAICDVGDEAYDSGVFIQGNSLNCTNTPTITASTTPANCGALGSATVTVTNYTGTPTYQWIPGGATTDTVSNLAAGTYSCLVGLQSGCGTITQTVTAVVGSQGATLTYSTTTQNPLCPGGANGSASVVVGGGAAPYTYTWSTAPPQNTAATTPTLPAGTYTVAVMDNTGCLGSTIVTLTNPPAIVATVTTSPTTCSGSTGSATATVVSNGTAPYNYVWNTGGTTQTINNLAQGVYTVSISDANSCTATATGTVGTQGFTWTPVATATNPLCLGAANGSAMVSITNPPAGSTFTYSWSTIPAQTTSLTTSSLVSGTYSVTVTDNNGCVMSTSVTLTDPPPVTTTVNTTPTICSGAIGSATVSVLSGGTAPYTYAWLTAPVQTSSVAVNLAQGTYSVITIDVNGCSSTASGTVNTTGFTWTPVASASTTKCFGSANGSATVVITNPVAGSTYSYTWTPTGQTNATASNLPVGNYTVTVEDNNSCITTATTTVTQPTLITLSSQSNPAICTSSSGAAGVSAIGGTPPYTYSWGTSPVQTTQIANNLLQGQYSVTVTDANNCVATTTVVVGDTAYLKVQTTQNPDLCNQGVGKATANPNSAAPYTFVWNTTPVQTTQVADSLKTGNYTVTVTDGFGCISSASIMVMNQNDVLATDFSTSPAGTINAEDPIAINVTVNSPWQIDSAFLSNGVVIDKNPFPYIFAEYGNYTATYYFTSKNGCKDTITYDLIVKDYITLYIPSAFTPNGDGRNDYFEAQGTFIKSFELDIYDRWGVLVKKMTDISNVWDGTKNGGPAPEDTYVYKGIASDIFGKHVSFHGQINLIR